MPLTRPCGAEPFDLSQSRAEHRKTFDIFIRALAGRLCAVHCFLAAGRDG
jgi:hypothetical protein